ncbi:MAG: LPS export ABC transporter periplasmic protein LptC [Armatimonadetes bacterium]|nr:LPS export ABC transporter periplasmic protein LptC [Armatimonadota bacterium]
MLAACAAFLFVAAGCGRHEANKEPGELKTHKGGPGLQIPDQRTKGPSGQTIKPSNPPKPAQPERPKLELIQRGVTLKWIEKDGVRMQATVREVQGQELTKTARFSNFTGQMYENGKITTTMSAPKVVLDAVNRTVTATGGVLLKSMVRNTTVKAKWVKWYARRQKVVGDGGVDITSEMGTIQGAAFVADTALKNWTILSSAKGLEY